MSLLFYLVANILDCKIRVSEFKLQLHYYVHFQTNTLDKIINFLIPPNYGINSTTIFFFTMTTSTLNNPQRLIYHQKNKVGWVFGFYGISTIVDYLMPNPFLYKLTVLFQTIQFSIITQFNCQKHFYFKLFSLVKQF